VIQIAQDISSSVQAKKHRRCGHRRGFLTCAIGEIDKLRCVSYFPTVPNLCRKNRTGDDHRWAGEGDLI
jgi:hypothetical protein